MSLFSDESVMQKWLSEKFANGESLGDLTINLEDYQEIEIDKRDSLIVQKIKTSFSFCVASFNLNEVITENENISLDNKDSLKPDFVLYAPETESLIIVELKNIKGPSRQAGTEIGAYGAELKAYLPFISEGEIVNVILSTVWPALLKHYIFNEICWLHRNLICLEPLETNEGIQLQIVDPILFAQSDISDALNLRQLSGYQICLYDDELYKGGNYYRIGIYENRMMAAMNAMAVRGNNLKTHGFAFLWRHCWQVGLAPYNITVVNFSPFQTFEKLHQRSKIKKNKITTRLKKLMREHAPDGHGYALESIRIAANPFLETFCSPQPEGFMTWQELAPNIWDGTDALSFKAWGFFDELISNELAREYAMDAEWAADSPLFANRILDMLSYYI